MTKQTSSVRYVFGSMKAGQTQQKRRRGGRPTTKLPTSLDELKTVTDKLTEGEDDEKA